MVFHWQRPGRHIYGSTEQRVSKLLYVEYVLYIDVIPVAVAATSRSHRMFTSD